MADSVFGSGVVAAPAAAAVIASAIAPVAGDYTLDVVTSFTLGGPVAADVVNMRVQRNVTAPLNVGLLGTPPALNVPVRHPVIRLALAAGEVVGVYAVANATVGVSYSAELTLTRAG